MTILDNETVVVDNFEDLKAVIEEDNTYKLIYLDADIIMTGGIRILNSKSELTIDGTYNTTRHTLTQFPSTAPGHTIYLQGVASNLNITVKNMDVIGENFYGIVCIYDTSAFPNVVVNYINIDYEGPQMAFNPRGGLFITECKINIIAATSPAHEVAETRNVTLGGNITITTSSVSHAVFWIRYVTGGVYPYINIAPGANVSITHTENALFNLTSATYMDMTFGDGSVTNLILDEGMGGSNSHLSNNVLIDNNAEVNIEQTAQYLSTSTWNIRGEFKMNSGSSLKMISDYTGSTSNSCLRFTTNNAIIDLNNPKSLVLYNRLANAITTNTTIPFTMSIPQYNRWLAVTPLPSAGGIEDLPNFSWYKIENLSNLTVEGTFTLNSTTITSDNLTPAEKSQLPELTDFLLSSTRVLSMGRPSLSINPITDLTTDITGTTVPGADVKISYGGNDYDVIADSNGDFSHTYGAGLPIGTTISFIANFRGSFLYRFREVEIIFDGDINIVSATTQVTFENTPFQQSPTLYNRANELEVIVNDSRINTTEWKLYAAIDNELANEKGEVLTQGLVFIDDNDDMTPLTGAPTLVYTSDGVTPGTIPVTWLDEKGVLLQLNIVPIKLNTTYRANISWIIE